MTNKTLYTVLAVVVLILLAIPVGGAVLVLGFGLGDSPCVMCWEQRIGMIIISLLGLFILRYGPRPRYIGLATLVGCWGIFMALRHMSLHAARDIGQGFALEVMGAHTYTWAGFIYWICIITMGLLMMTLREQQVGESGPTRTLAPLERTAFVVFVVLAAANVVQAITSTGPPPFTGQSDPIRYSFSPKHWVWSLEEWAPSPITLRGRFAVNRPDVTTTTPDPAAGPLVGLPVLKTLARTSVASLGLRGTPTDLAYDPTSQRFAIATQLGIHLLPSTLDRIDRYTVIDPGFSVDIGQFGSATFLDPQTILLMGENKSYVMVKENPSADPDKNFRFFLESAGAFDDVGRGRFTTVRARLYFSMAVAYDASTNSIFTITAPNQRTRRLIVSRFDRSDMTLSEEFSPTLDPASGLRLTAEGRSIEELFVTAATMHEGRLYVLSANFGTLLAIDPATKRIVSAYAIPGLVQPTGLAFSDRGLHVIAKDGSVTSVEAPAHMTAAQ